MLSAPNVGKESFSFVVSIFLNFGALRYRKLNYRYRIKQVERERGNVQRRV